MKEDRWPALPMRSTLHLPTRYCAHSQVDRDPTRFGFLMHSTIIYARTHTHTYCRGINLIAGFCLRSQKTYYHRNSVRVRINQNRRHGWRDGRMRDTKNYRWTVDAVGCTCSVYIVFEGIGCWKQNDRSGDPRRQANQQKCKNSIMIISWLVKLRFLSIFLSFFFACVCACVYYIVILSFSTCTQDSYLLKPRFYDHQVIPQRPCISGGFKFTWGSEFITYHVEMNVETCIVYI